jgi:hypothetical protein
MVTKARQRILAYEYINRLPIGQWYNLGDMCQQVRLNPRTFLSFLKEAKRMGVVEYQSFTTPNGFGSSNWNSMWKRTADLEVPTQ